MTLKIFQICFLIFGISTAAAEENCIVVMNKEAPQAVQDAVSGKGYVVKFGDYQMTLSATTGMAIKFNYPAYPEASYGLDFRIGSTGGPWVTWVDFMGLTPATEGQTFSVKEKGTHYNGRTVAKRLDRGLKSCPNQ